MFKKNNDKKDLPMTPFDSNKGQEPKNESEEAKPISEKSEIEDFYKGNRNKKLTCHIMVNNRKEVGRTKSRIYNQEFTWKKRIYPIEQSRIITDVKGDAHLYVDVNDCACLSFDKDHADTCKKCKGKMTIDAKNARDLVKRKTISSIWGVDSSHIMMLLIMGIVLMIMIMIVFYMYLENTKLNTKLQTYLTPPNVPKPTDYLENKEIQVYNV